MRAAVYLARHRDDGPAPGRRIAADLNIPPKYLSSILRELVRAGVLEASPGKTGGFRMVRRPEEVRLSDVLTPFESASSTRNTCPFGNHECSDRNPCDGHTRWKRVKEEYRRFLEETTVRDVAMPASRRERKPASKPLRPG